jgi:putative hydrolase of the HAD superfamily
MLELIHQKVVSGELRIDEARRERFRRLLADAGAEEAVQNERALDLARRYRAEYERDWCAVQGALELLSALRNAGIRVGVVTNNLRAEQLLKIERCGLARFIDALITSEDAGIAKPNPAIFVKALEVLGLHASETVMVGDVWDTDIAGALAAGVRPVWYNWRGLPPREPRVVEVRTLSGAETLAALGC